MIKDFTPKLDAPQRKQKSQFFLFITLLFILVVYWTLRLHQVVYGAEQDASLAQDMEVMDGWVDVDIYLFQSKVP